MKSRIHQHIVALLLVGSGCGTGAPSLHAAVDFVRDVKPLLDARCITCHGPLKQKGGLRLDAGALVLQGGKHGPVVQPKNPAESKLIERVLSQDEDERMPSEGKPLSVAEVAVLRDWIAAGAPVPAREEIVSRPEDHWFFQPPERAALPKVSGVRPAAPAIDRFIAAEWQARGLKPQQPADKATLLRRVYLDLIGLPPLPEEVAAFESDTAPDAYERVVDKLLADPRHGARWARHFMDIWRYSDEMIYDGDSAGTPLVGDYHPWRWRDWIIDAINANKPYDRMIQEMLAADELAPEDNDNLRATGYLVRSANELGERDVWLFDAVEHTAQAFLGVTMKCARCHDHKYDPIPQTDYYRLRAVFEPMQKRLDYLPGWSNPRQSGLPRIYDADLAVRTALYVNGNPQQKDTNKVITPGVPTLLKAGDLAAAELKLPASVAHPGRLAFVRAARLAEARSNWEKARDAFDKLAANKGSTNTASPSATNLSMIQLAIVERRVVEAKLAVAEIDLLVAEQSIAADDVKSDDKPDAEAFAQNAAESQRALKHRQAELEVAEAVREHAKTSADEKEKKEQPKTEAARKKIAEARDKLAKLEEEAKKTPAKYEPLWKSYPEKSTGRRLAFAQWMTSRTNPATARVLVNHVWMRHFGQPLVDTVFDFGLHGHKPTHPALMDWLAVEFMESGWNLKHLHRLLVTSAAYRQSSARQPGGDNERLDPENHFLWRMNSQRMQAEQVRDSILYLSGKLELTAGGPALAPTQSDRVFRRSLYFQRTIDRADKLLAAFDCADPNECYRRGESVVPQQALALANSRLTFEHARLIAKALAETNSGDGSFVRAAFERTLCRGPNLAEMKACLDYLQTRRETAPASADDPPLNEEKEPLVAAATDPAQRARESLVQVLLNHTDFVTIR